MIWTAQLTYPAAALGKTDSNTIRAALESIAWVEHNTDRSQLQITMDADAETLADATDIVLAAADDATGLLKPIRLTVMPAADFTANTQHPPPLDIDLLRITDIAALLHVSRQRADQLASKDPDFPAPVARTGRGRLYARPSIEAYVQRRTEALASPQ